MIDKVSRDYLLLNDVIRVKIFHYSFAVGFWWDFQGFLWSYSRVEWRSLTSSWLGIDVTTSFQLTILITSSNLKHLLKSFMKLWSDSEAFVESKFERLYHFDRLTPQGEYFNYSACSNEETLFQDVLLIIIIMLLLIKS